MQSWSSGSPPAILPAMADDAPLAILPGVAPSAGASPCRHRVSSARSEDEVGRPASRPSCQAEAVIPGAASALAD